MILNISCNKLCSPPFTDKNIFLDIGTNYYVEKNQQEAVEFFDRKLKYVEENMDKVAPQVQQKQNSKMMVERELVEKMKAAKMVKPK